MTPTYQWLRNGRAIAGATGGSYVPTAADRGTLLSVRVSATAPGHAAGTATTQGARVQPGTLANPTPPRLKGRPQVGARLRVERGSWGPGAVTLTVQWLRNGVPIKGETGAAYRLKRLDKGNVVAARVTATKAGYASATRVVKSAKIR